MPASLIIQTSFLGDVVLTTPLISRLAARGPVTVVTTPQGGALLEGHPGIHRLVPYAKRGEDAGVAGFVRLARTLRAPDDSAVVYLAQGSHRSGALARAAGYRRRVGFATSAGRAWYTETVEVPPDAHHARRLWLLAGGGEEAHGDLRPRLYPSPDHVAAADHWAAGVSAPLVALAPGSVWGTKRWPHYPQLAAQLAAMGIRPVIIGGPGDTDVAATILRSAPETIDTTGQLPPLATAALLQRCRAVVTNDSLPLHLASAMDTPTVAIFGPTRPAFGFGPLASQARIAEHTGLACRPCHRHGPAVCPEGHFRCMRDLVPDRIVTLVRELTV